MREPRAGATPGAGLAETPHRPQPEARATETAEIKLRFGRRGGLRVSASMTPAGLMAVAGLVSGILLSTAIIVRAAKGARRGRPPRSLD